MPSTVPHFGCLEFGICDKGDPREESKRAERERPTPVYYFEKHTKESPGNIQLPGPPIRIKGLPKLLEYNPSYLLSPKTYLSMYA